MVNILYLQISPWQPVCFEQNAQDDQDALLPLFHYFEGCRDIFRCCLPYFSLLSTFRSELDTVHNFFIEFLKIKQDFGPTGTAIGISEALLEGAALDECGIGDLYIKKSVAGRTKLFLISTTLLVEYG